MTKEQKNVIRRLNRVLKDCTKHGIWICGMDCDLYYASDKAREAAIVYPKRPHGGSDYCPTAVANMEFGYSFEDGMSEEVGILYSDCYDDSGGW